MATSSCTANTASNSGLSRINDELLRIVMVGKTGAGKSATGNTILGQKYFESKLRATFLTGECSKGRAEVDGQKVAVIDTPGLFDTRFGKDKTNQDLSQCITFAAPGPHVFLVIISLGRYTEEEKQTVQKIQEIFGEAADKYSMLLFTCGDELEDTTIEEFLDGRPDLQELVARCNGQYHVFNNKVKDRSQVIELLQKIREICKKNTGSHYTNKMFKEAERAVEEKKQRILRENEEQRRKEQEELQKKYEEKLGEEMKKLDKKLQIKREKERKEREKERKMEKQHMYKETKREREEREAEMRRVREEKERKIENMRRQLVEANERQLREEKERLQNKHESEAREKAEGWNPFYIFEKAHKKLVCGFVHGAVGIAGGTVDGAADIAGVAVEVLDRTADVVESVLEVLDGAADIAGGLLDGAANVSRKFMSFFP